MNAVSPGCNASAPARRDRVTGVSKDKASTGFARRPLRASATLLPGLVLCLAVTGAALALEHVEVALFGRAWLESLVLAIVLGTALRSFKPLDARLDAGIRFSARFLLETAVMLLGASMSAAALFEHGGELLGGIALVVLIAIFCSYGIGRLARLPHKLALLIACGNSICGNSAIAAVAPVIDASSEDVASSIAFTAVLGVMVVILLPLLAPLLSLSDVQYGIFAGLTVYAVPQVLAATAPVAMVSVHVGTMVKLVRVLMLGPVILVLSIAAARESNVSTSFSRLVPWFILGFLLLMGLRSFDLIPHGMLAPVQAAAKLLTVMSMAALGLGVDVRSVLRAGRAVTLVVVLSLLVLGIISYGLIVALGMV
jgi:uncharacterized integral membrane protein (TIGR00698 family)